MLDRVHKSACDGCGRQAFEIQHLVSIGDTSICNDCVSFAGRKMGLIPPPEGRSRQRVAVRDVVGVTFFYSLELRGHLDQPFDVFLVQNHLKRVSADDWDVSIELACVERSDGFVREAVARGEARIRVDLLVRSLKPVSESALRVILEDRWARLTCVHDWMVESKGLRDLLEPRFAGMSALLTERAALIPWQ